jgi:anti-anti-sigma regulatory factor
LDARETLNLALPSFLDTEAAVGLVTTLKTVLAGGSDVVIDGSEVRRLGTPGVQVLLAAAQAFAAANQHFRVTAVSPEFQSVFDDLGLHADLNAWRH